MSIRKMTVDVIFFCRYLERMEIGTILADARKEAGLQQKALAETLGISQSYLCDLEANRRVFPMERVEQLPLTIRSKVAAALLESQLLKIESLRAWAAE
jgi:transcriptional regulator with XRE-family HTH domain